MKVELQLTANCNLECIYCCNADYPGKKGELSLDAARDIISLEGIEKVIFTGGEPLICWENLVSLIDFAHKNKLATQINTNGLLLTKERIARLEQVGMDIAYISYEGANPNGFFELRGRDYISDIATKRYGQFIKNLQNVAGSNIRLEIDYTITSKNLGEIVDIYSKLVDIKADSMNIRNVLVVGRADESLRATDKQVIDELHALANKIRRDISSLEVNIGALDFRINDSKLVDVADVFQIFMCAAGKSSFYIRTNGDVYACNNVPESIMGNIYSPVHKTPSENFLSIVNGDRDTRIQILQNISSCSCAEMKCNNLVKPLISLSTKKI